MIRALLQRIGGMTHDDVIRWFPWFLSAAFGIILITLFIFVFNFASRGSLSGDPARWGQFGDFVGGLANPWLSFLSLLVLLLALVLQGKQLDNSNKQLSISLTELQEARRELARAALAQEASHKELARTSAAAIQTADLLSIGLLLEQYRKEMALLSARSLARSDPLKERLEDLQTKEVTLLKKIDQLFQVVAENRE